MATSPTGPSSHVGGDVNNDEFLLAQLESCAQVLMSPPTSISADQLNAAQAVFVDFQKMKQPFELCRKILERPSSSPYVKFQAASCLRAGVIRDWSYLKEENRKVQLVSYLLEYVTSNTLLESYVREQLLLVSAITLKRIGIDECPGGFVRMSERIREEEQQKTSVVKDIIKSILQMQSSPLESFAPNIETRVHQMFVATSFLHAVLSEYSSSTRASDFGLPWIKHLDAKKRFEVTYLKQVFNSTLTALNLVVGEQSPLRLRLADYTSKEGKTVNDLLLKLLHLLETIFTWNFEIITVISTQYAIHVDSIETPIFQPPIDWRETLIDDNVIQFLFYLYRIVRSTGQESLIHSTLQSLSQFSSLTGAIIADPKLSLKFVSNLITGTVPILRDHGSDLKACEVNPLSLVLYRICLHLQDRDTLKVLDKSLTHQFIELFSNVTCNMMVSCMKAESGKHLDDEFDRYKMAVENACDAWSIILQAVGKYDQDSRNSFSDDFGGGYEFGGLDLISSLKNGSHSSSSLTQPRQKEELIDSNLLKTCTNKVFVSYIQCHISVPQGFKEIELDEEEIEEYEEDDHVTYFDQLNALGSLGRVDLTTSLSSLSQLLTLRISQLQSFMEKMASEGKSSVSEAEWSAVNEDIHWLIMISTWILSSCTWLSDRDLIPDEVMRLSIAASADVSKTLIALKNCDPGPLEDPSIDPVVRLIIIIFKLCKLEQYVIEHNMQLFSPQVSSTICQFVSRFLTGYMMPNENDYKEMSMTVVSCFGRDSPSALEVLDFLVGHILSKMVTWSSEASVKEASALALVSFISNSVERSKCLVKSSQIMRLFELHANHQINQALSVQARKYVFQLLVMLASQKTDLFPQIFSPLTERYTQLKSSLTSQKDLSEGTGSAIIELMESFIGMSCGSTPSNINNVWDQFLGIFYINEVPALVDVFHNYNLVIVAILDFVNCITNRLLCFLPNDQTLKFYEATINLFNVYAKHNKGRVTTEAGADEESIQDIILLIQILNNLASKDFIDWFPPAVGTNELKEDPDIPTVTASQVIFMGLGILMPLLSAELLQAPKLSQSYYKLMSFLCDETEKLAEVPPALLDSIMSSLQLALTTSTLSSEIKCNCLSLITTLAQRCSREDLKYAGIKTRLEPFMSTLLEFTLSECGTSKDVTLRENVASSMYSMIRCFPSTFSQLVDHLIQTHVTQRNDPQLGIDLRKAFDSLVSDIGIQDADSGRQAPIHFRSTKASTAGIRAFRQRFDPFVTDLIGLLRIK